MPHYGPRGPTLSSGVLSPTRRTVLAAIAASAVSAVLEGPPAIARASDLPTTIAEAGKRFRSGGLTSLDLTNAYLAGIEKLEPQLNAFIAVLKEEALKTATERDAEMRTGKDRGPLHGVPIVVKDLFEMRGTRTTVGSKAFKDRATDRDATVVRKLLDAGVVVLGKTNMNEFAAGVSGTNATFGDTHNPWNLDRSPGVLRAEPAPRLPLGFVSGVLAPIRVDPFAFRHPGWASPGSGRPLGWSASTASIRGRAASTALDHSPETFTISRCYWT